MQEAALQASSVRNLGPGKQRQRLTGDDVTLIMHAMGLLAAEKGTERILRAYEIVRGQLREGAVHLQMATAMVRLALDRAQAVRLGRGARVTAAQLSWSAELDRLDTLYRGILPEQADRAPGVTVAVA